MSARSEAARVAECVLTACRSQPPRTGDALTLRNETAWSTHDLKRAVRACCRAFGVSERRTVRVYHGRRGGCIGLATVRGRWMQLGVVAPVAGPTTDTLDLASFCRVLEHELLHNLGLDHKDMPRKLSNEVPHWAAGLSVRPKATVAARIVPSADQRRTILVLAREKRAREGLERWERKHKQAAAKVKEWRRKVRYYDRKLAASPDQRVEAELDKRTTGARP